MTGAEGSKESRGREQEQHPRKVGKEEPSRASWGWHSASLCGFVIAALLFWSRYSSGGDDFADDGVPVYTLKDLRNYQGENGDRTLLLAVLGRVFNVTSGAEFYGQGSGYHLFAGRDCTHAFAIGSMKKKWLDKDIATLSAEKLEDLNNTYWNTYVRKYPIAGRLADPPYDAAAYDHLVGPYAEINVTGADVPRLPNATGQSMNPLAVAARTIGSAIAKFIPLQSVAPSWGAGAEM